MAGLGSIIGSTSGGGGSGHMAAAKAIRGMYGASKKPTGGRVAPRAQAARRKANVKRRRTR